MELLKYINDKININDVVGANVSIAIPTIESIRRLEEILYEHVDNYIWWTKKQIDDLYYRHDKGESCIILYNHGGPVCYARYLSKNESNDIGYKIINVEDLIR